MPRTSFQLTSMFIYKPNWAVVVSIFALWSGHRGAVKTKCNFCMWSSRHPSFGGGGLLACYFLAFQLIHLFINHRRCIGTEAHISEMLYNWQRCDGLVGAAFDYQLQINSWVIDIALWHFSATQLLSPPPPPPAAATMVTVIINSLLPRRVTKH